MHSADGHGKGSQRETCKVHSCLQQHQLLCPASPIPRRGAKALICRGSKNRGNDERKAELIHICCDYVLLCEEEHKLKDMK